MMIYTIGHSNMTQESFALILKSFEIDIVVDVRSSPYSKFVPHFNRENIKKSLIENGMRYTYSLVTISVENQEIRNIMKTVK